MPRAVVNPLTYDEHRELAREIQNTKSRLLQLSSVVTGVYGPQSHASFQFQKVNEAVERLWAELQAQAEVDFPGLDASTLYK
jgi:hypothetical protein